MVVIILIIGGGQMLVASILAHIALGALFALFFVYYYINGDGKSKVFLEILLGSGNFAGMFILYRTFKIDDTTINLLSMASCMFSFLIITFILIILLAFIIKDKENDDIMKLRDIILGQASWVKEFRDKREKEIDEKLNYNILKNKENDLDKREKIIKGKELYLKEEFDKLEQLGDKKVKFHLPEKSNIIITNDYIEMIPSYFRDIINCILAMNALEKKYLDENEFNFSSLRAYLISLSTTISSNIFNSNSTDIRIHFRYYNKRKEGYDKLIAIIGNKIVKQDMTFIPKDSDNMIMKSYECKRALIKSINYNFDYKSHNKAIWKDYLTYTFHNFETGGIPILSFGISVKNETRYKKIFYVLNYIKFEEYLQEKIDNLHNFCDLQIIIYGGDI